METSHEEYPWKTKQYNWHTARKYENSLRSPWISISRTWRKAEALPFFKLGNGSRIAFWTNMWVDVLPVGICYPRLFKIAILPNESIAAHWDRLISSWSITFCRLLKEEITNFQDLLETLPNQRVSEDFDRRPWSLIHQANFQSNLSQVIYLFLHYWIEVCKAYEDKKTWGE